MSVIEIILEVLHTLADLLIIVGAVVGWVYYRRMKKKVEEVTEIVKEEFVKVSEFVNKIKEGIKENPLSKLLGM